MAKRNDKSEMAEPQEQKKATPVTPPEAKRVQPMSFFDDSRMANNSGVRDFSPKRVTSGNEQAPSKEHDA